MWYIKAASFCVRSVKLFQCFKQSQEVQLKGKYNGVKDHEI